MQESLNNPPSSSTQTPQPEFWVSSDLLLSLAVGPLLVGMAFGSRLLDALQQVGSASEEVFRGDRLPMLNLKSPASPTSPVSERH
ncbi:MAG: hypothetical protein LRZ84_18390 [Desertifilum sp.]|nr:hypothetical protein [Desertifilum sp.]MDI9635470.1 hypothetical protein [Geitlerinema splendidum]